MQQPLSAADLLALDDPQFKRVVDEELRGRHSENDPATSTSLRSPEVIDRLYQLLLSMQRNTEGQLAAKALDFDVLKGRMLADGRARQSEYMKAKAEYGEQRARTIRFKTSLEQLLLEVKNRRDTTREGMYESMVIEERDHLARRVRELEQAIRDHRDSFPDDLEPEEHDLHLWACLTVSAE